MTVSPSHAGLLLAGGASSRFGASKADAELAGLTLGEIALLRLANSCDRIAVAGRVARAPRDIAELSDPVDLTRGPLGGILAGLEWAKGHAVEWLAISPCDMPLLPGTIHRDMLTSALAAEAPIAMAISGSGHNPLCAVWSTSLASAVRERLDVAHPSIWRLAMELGATSLPLNDELMTLNVNTQADLERAASLTDYHWWTAQTEA